MKIQERTIGPVTVLDIRGQLVGGSAADVFRTQIKELIERGVRRIVLNMKDVTWINSCGTGILIGGYVVTKRNDVRLKIVEVNERVNHFFFTIGIRQIIDIYDTEEEALVAFETDPIEEVLHSKAQE